MIKAKKVRLIADDGEQKGIVPFDDAINYAREKNMDLVQVSDKADPVVCRIMDYGKYKYKQKKRETEAKKRQKSISVKHIRLGVKIDDHDLQIKLRKAAEFLEESRHVQFSVMFKGREMSHKEIGYELLKKVMSRLEDISTVISPPKLEGRRLLMTVRPKAPKK